MSKPCILLGQIDNIDIDLSEALAIYMPPETESVDVIPSTEKQTILPSDKKYFDKVNVEAVTADIDSNIVPENIKLGATILGVEGNVAPDKPDQTKTVVPTEEEQVVRADTGYELGECIVKPIPSQYEDVTAEVKAQNVIVDNIQNIMDGMGEDVYYTGDATATASDIALGKSAYIGGGKVEGTYVAPDLTDATATANDIAQGKTAYIGEGKVTGTLVDRLQWKCDNIKSLDDEFRNYTDGDFYDLLIGLDTSKVTSMGNTFYYCTKLTRIPLFNTSNVTNMSGTFRYNFALKEIPLLDMSKVKSLQGTFEQCLQITAIPQFNTSNVTYMGTTFLNCPKLKICPALNTEKVENIMWLFYGCNELETVTLLNLISCTYASDPFNNCYALKNLTLKNIKISLQIGSGTSWGHLLTLDSLVNTIKELWDRSSETSTNTLTMGSANKEKIANVYVKLITPTAEQEAEDPYINNKKPCVVCESTDEGAMLIEDYARLKNWEIA